MATVIVTNSEIHREPSVVPPALSDFVNPTDFAYICQRFRGIDADAACCGLAASAILCLCITPLACFLCPCFAACRASSERSRIAMEMNRTFFQGNMVIQADFNGLVFRLDLIPNYTVLHTTIIMPTNPQAAPVYAQAEYSTDSPLASATIAQPPSAIQQKEQQHHHHHHHHGQQQQRMMAFRVPANFSAGQTITVQTPDQTFIQVVIPEGVSPGEEIMLPY